MVRGQRVTRHYGYSVLHIRGTLNLERGWVDEFLRAFRLAGLRAPAPHVVRWYRSRLARSPEVLETYGWPNPETLADLSELSG